MTRICAGTGGGEHGTWMGMDGHGFGEAPVAGCAAVEMKKGG
jgi:hypothetical protein